MKTFIVFRRELMGYFLSPIAWVVIVAFSIATAVYFELVGLGRNTASLVPVYNLSALMFTIAFPALTMGSLAGEFRNGTLEMLATDPVRDVEIVLGKFLAVVSFFSAALLPLLFYYLLFRMAGAQPDAGPVWSGLLGMLLCGSLCAAVGLFASSLTSSHTIAFVLAFLAILVLRLVGSSQPLELPAWLTGILEYLSIQRHLVGLLRGRIASDDIVYFLSTTALFLFLSTRILEARRWA